MKSSRFDARLSGVLVIDKPSGPSSFDVVRRVRGASRVRRVGHGGTLDPMASGVLPVCLGQATKLAQFLLDAEKEYRASVTFGSETDTGDAEGEVTSQSPVDGLTAEKVRGALESFRGQILQVPPAYSAIKRNGRPLYSYARAGEAVEVQARPITIFELELETWDEPAIAGLRVRCSKGTYVRSLAVDIGRALGCGAHLSGLRRTVSGAFALHQAVPLAEALAQFANNTPPGLIEPAQVLAHLPTVQASGEAARGVACGQKLDASQLGAGNLEAHTTVRVLSDTGALLAVSQIDEEGRLVPLRVFADDTPAPAIV